MASMEKLEMARYKDELEDDLRHLLNKYCRIMSWDVPELDEEVARGLILDALHNSLKKIES